MYMYIQGTIYLLHIYMYIHEYAIIKSEKTEKKNIIYVNIGTKKYYFWFKISD